MLVSTRLFRVGGGAGGGPRFDVAELPVCWGLIEVSLPGAATGGGGGGGAFPRRSLLAPLMFSSKAPSLALFSCFCSI